VPIVSLSSGEADERLHRAGAGTSLF